MEENKPSPHDIKELKKQEREIEREKARKSLDAEKRNKRITKFSLIGIPILVFIVFIVLIFKSAPSESYTQGEVHWHASLTVNVCGNAVQMPRPFGEHHLGLPLLHTHEDGLIHIEGKIWKKEDIMLGKYFEVLGVNFKDNELIEYKNNDKCPNGNQGKVKMYVNGKENNELTKYVIQDSDKLELKFE